MVGTVTSLQVQETPGEVVRVTWVSVQGATAYRVSWRRTDGNLSLVHLQFHFCEVYVTDVLRTLSQSHFPLLQLCAAVGSEEQSQMVAGDVTAVDLNWLDPGAQYEVQVTALVQNREGTPVSVRVTTRESPILLSDIKSA